MSFIILPWASKHPWKTLPHKIHACMVQMIHILPVLPDITKLNQYMSFHFDPNIILKIMNIIKQMAPIIWTQTPVELSLKNEESPFTKFENFHIGYLPVYWQLLQFILKLQCKVPYLLFTEVIKRNQHDTNRKKPREFDMISPHFVLAMLANLYIHSVIVNKIEQLKLTTAWNAIRPPLTWQIQ